MEDLPEELRTPPVALVALVGMPELHPQISMSLHTEQPPINTLALPDFSKVPVIGGKEGAPLDARIPAPLGILKADWMHKHRTKVPAVLAVLFNREQVNGDPAQWMEVCSHLDNIKNVTRGRNTKLVVAIVQPTLHGEINDDRMIALRKRAELDAKCCLTFISHDPTELKRSLARLGSILGELANLYYKEQSRRVKARLDKKNWSSTDIAVRFNFKMGYYAEFRRDWVTALRFYETAYTLLQEILSTPGEIQTLQRTVELKAVAEQLHFKVSTLLLHSGKETEAIKWFKHHITRFKKLAGPSEGGFLHLAWVSQQYNVFGDLLKTSRSTAAPSSIVLAGSGVVERELQPGFYYQVAAAYMTERRQNFERAFATFESFDDPDAPDVLAGTPEEIGPPGYVGQGPCVLSREPDKQSPTPDEYLRHAMLTERQFSHSHAANSLLAKAHEQYKLIQAPRMIYYILTEMGREYFHAGDHDNAKRLFHSVAGMYRKEAWVVLLAASLEYLRESARQLGLTKEYVEYSLELAALPLPETRCDPYTEVIAAIKGEGAISVSDSAPISLEIDLVSPLRGVLSVCVAFHDQTVKPGTPTCLTISLLTHLPEPLELTDLAIHFNQQACNLVLKHCHGQGTVNAYDLRLLPHQWKRVVVDIVAERSGKLECLFAVARLEHNAVIRCQVESPASREPDLLWHFEQALESYPVKDMNLSFSGQKVIQVEEVEPKVDIELEAGGIALVGETVLVSVCVRSKGHAIDAGELRVSVSEGTSSDGHQAFSPTTPSRAIGAAHARIFLPARFRDGNGDILLWELQGSIKVPYIEEDGSWSIPIYLTFTEVRPISLAIALGYRIQFGTGDDTHQLWVHKRLDLTCEDALEINCKYIAPFQRDAFLPSSIDRSVGTVLPLNETSMMVITAKNISSVPLSIAPIHIEERNSRSCQVFRLEAAETAGGVRNSCISRSSDATKLLPGEVFKQILRVRPLIASSSLDIGTLAWIWEREQQQDQPEVVEISSIDEIMNSSKTDATGILKNRTTSRVALPPITVEKAPVIVSLQHPPYGLLSTPFTMSFLVQNRTNLIQEIKFAVVDAQSFLVSGASRGSISLLPSSTESLSLKLVPIACGMQQLPQVVLTLAQCNASYQPPAINTQMFVFPSQPRLEPKSVEAYRRESSSNEAEGAFY